MAAQAYQSIDAVLHYIPPYCSGVVPWLSSLDLAKTCIQKQRNLF